MFKIKCFLIFIIFLIVPSITAFEIGITWKDEAYIEEVYATYNIVGKDAHVNIVADIIVSPKYYKEHPHLNIYFKPWERSNHAPIENFNEVICNGKGTGSGYFYLSFTCYEDGKEINYSLYKAEDYRPYRKGNKYYNINYTSYYYYELNLTESDEYEEYMIYFNYTIPDFVRIEGDYNIVRLTYENMHLDAVKNDNIYTYIVLSKEYSFPSVEPFDKKEVSFDSLVDGRWVVKLDGYRERYVKFIDEVAQKIKIEKERIKNLILGTILGGIVSIIVSLFVLLIQIRYHNDIRMIGSLFILSLLIGILIYIYLQSYYLNKTILNINWLGILITLLVILIGLLIYLILKIRD